MSRVRQLAVGFALLVLLSPQSAAAQGWAATGSLETARTLHTQTTLSDGRVLVAGGHNAAGVLSSAEIYDPATETWSATGAMNTPRSDHMAIRLPNGRVLVSGGTGAAGSALSSAELYNPVTGVWSTTGSMTTARAGHQAILYPGMPEIFVVGGTSLKTADVYVVNTGVWVNTIVNLNAVHGRESSFTVFNGSPFVVGGIGSAATASTEIYVSAQGGQWISRPSMPAARYGHTATVLPGINRLLVAGGIVGGVASSSVLLLAETPTPSWTATEAMLESRSGHVAATLPSGEVIVAGGHNGAYLATSERFNPTLRTWGDSEATTMPRGGGHRASVISGGRVLMTGGYDGTSFLASSDLYTPHTFAVSAGEDQYLSANGFGLATVNLTATPVTTSPSATTYSWSGPNGFNTTGPDVTTPLFIGAYSFTVTATNAVGEVRTDSVVIHVLPPGRIWISGTRGTSGRSRAAGTDGPDGAAGTDWSRRATR
ncbi:MAG TPA: kelch repeat-containing protein [Vicinamibacterales bacterium]|nr:kelch repeat-containing protein [Vicinamibacterales bacterium]